jgi:hypothetical protein
VRPVAATASAPGTRATALAGSSAVGRSSQTGVPSARDVASLANALNISTAALNTHLTKGGLLSFTAGPSGAVSPAGSSSALAGLPLDEWGTPDFDAIKAAGGTVTGTMPPNGGSKMIVLDGNRTVLYSAQIEFPDGRSQYVRGMAHQSDGSGTASTTFKSLSDALGFLRGLPGSMAEARNRIGEYNNGLRSTIDFAM